MQKPSIPRLWKILITSCLLLSFILLFIPGGVVKYKSSGNPFYGTLKTSFYDYPMSDYIAPVFTVVAAGLIIAAIVFLWKDGLKQCLYFSFGSLLPIIACLIGISTESGEVGSSYVSSYPEGIFYFDIIVVIAVFVLIFIAKKKMTVGEYPKKKEAEKSITSLPPEEELLKLKSLFDNGILTQEEFNSKKSEILKRL